MNTRKSLWLVPLLAVMAAAGPLLRAAEMVTIPKSRLEELERKEAELDKLKAELSQTQGEKQRLESERARLQTEQAQLKQAKEAAEAKAAATAATAKAELVIPHDTPPLTTLPPLQKGEIVDAMDLMNHYRADAPAAEKRYGKGSIRVQGEVTGFEKPMFVSYYVMYLKTTESRWKVMCRVYSSATYSAVFTVKGGEEIAGSTSTGARTTLAKVGQKVVIEGRCNGLHGRPDRCLRPGRGSRSRPEQARAHAHGKFPPAREGKVGTKAGVQTNGSKFALTAIASKRRAQSITWHRRDIRRTGYRSSLAYGLNSDQGRTAAV